MGKIISTTAVALMVVLVACTGTGKDAIKKADSTNQARLDTALNRKLITVDEGSSAFLVRASDATVKIERSARSFAGSTGNEPFAAFFAETVGNEQALLLSIRALAGIKQVALPDTTRLSKVPTTNDNVKQLSAKYLLQSIVAVLKIRVELFENALLDAKDPDVRSFADQHLPALRTQLDAATRLLQ